MGAPQHSVVRHDHIEYGFWLVFDDAGGMRFARGAPSLDRKERGMKLTAKLPRSLFQTPSLVGTIDITDQVPDVRPIDITAASAALRASLGIDIDLRVVESEA